MICLRWHLGQVKQRPFGVAFDQFSKLKNPCFLVVNIMLFHKEPFAPKTSRMKRIGRW